MTERERISAKLSGTCYACFTFPLSILPKLKYTHSLITLLNRSEDDGRANPFLEFKMSDKLTDPVYCTCCVHTYIKNNESKFELWRFRWYDHRPMATSQKVATEGGRHDADCGRHEHRNKQRYKYEKYKYKNKPRCKIPSGAGQKVQRGLEPAEVLIFIF